eukprot:8765716-Alexandrium_andersonii.AAC.1
MPRARAGDSKRMPRVLRSVRESRHACSRACANSLVRSCGQVPAITAAWSQHAQLNNCHPTDTAWEKLQG